MVTVDLIAVMVKRKKGEYINYVRIVHQGVNKTR